MALVGCLELEWSGLGLVPGSAMLGNPLAGSVVRSGLAPGEHCTVGSFGRTTVAGAGRPGGKVSHSLRGSSSSLLVWQKL